MKAVFEKVITQDDSNIRAFLYSDQIFDAPWHVHPEFELTYILSSSGIRYVGNNISDYQPGDLVLLGPNLPHCWKDEQDPKTAARSYVIQWPMTLMDNLQNYRDIAGLHSLASRGICFKGSSVSSIKEQMASTIHSSSLNRYIELIKLLSEISKIEDREILAGPSYSYDLSNENNNRIKQVQSFVDQNYQTKIKLADIANQLSLTEQSFSRFFSKTMQRPFFVFLNEYRINRASRLLLETDKQVAEIGYECGYESLPFFYQQFKKFKNYSPQGFRKMYRSIRE